MFAIGFLLLGTRGLLPGLIYIIAGNGALLAGFFFARQGYRKFFDRQPFTQRDDIIVPLLVVILLTIFTYWQDRIDIRTMAASFGACWMSLRIAWELSTGIAKEMRAGAWFGAAFFWLAGLITLTRGFTAIAQPEQVEFFLPSWTNVSIYIFAIFVIAASTFTSLMLTSTRLEMELRNAQTELEMLAHTDHLTGLNNRRYFVETAQGSLSVHGASITP